MSHGNSSNPRSVLFERYGKTNPVKILNARNELRRAIAAGDIERIQAAWERLEPWIDAPQGLPLDMGAGDGEV